MPNYEFTDEEAQLLTALVLSFASEEGAEGRPIPAGFKVRSTTPPVKEPVYAFPVERGKAVYQKYGCVGCHGFEGRGGVKNFNAVTGGEVPPLTYVAQGFTKDQLKNLIRVGRYPTKADPHGPTPPLWMPTWKEKISEEELDDLVEFLVSLYPQEG